MKVALIVQRFGHNILGGAESHCYQLATQLADKLGWTVHVYTTTAFSYQTWANFYPKGTEKFHNMTILRYQCVLPRWPKIFGLYNRFFIFLSSYYSLKSKKKGKGFFNFIYKAFEKLWFILQGPWCPNLIKELRNRINDYDRFIFFTYLYYPTAFGAPEFKDKSVLIPLAHDEAPLSFPRIHTLFKSVPILCANTEAERDLIVRKGLAQKDKISVVGCGIDESYFSNNSHSHSTIAYMQKPYIAYLGRVSKGKGIFDLIQNFLQFILRTKNKELSLIIAGENDGSVDIFYHPQIKYIGYISESDKISLIANASCIVNPSPHESLSLLVLEAIALKKPVLVNSACNVLKFYAERLETVFAFNSDADFDKHLTHVLKTKESESFKLKLESSQAWVANRYSWNRVLESLQQCLQTTGK